MSSFKGINSLGEIQSIKTKLIAVIAGASVVTALCLGGFFIFSQIQANHQQLDHYRESLEKNVESSLKGETQVAYSILDEFYKKQQRGELTQEQAQKAAADSLDLFELVMSLEEEFGVEIPSEDLESIATVGDVINYMKEHGVEEKKKKKQPRNKLKQI